MLELTSYPPKMGYSFLSFLENRQSDGKKNIVFEVQDPETDLPGKTKTRFFGGPKIHPHHLPPPKELSLTASSLPWNSRSIFTVPGGFGDRNRFRPFVEGRWSTKHQLGVMKKRSLLVMVGLVSYLACLTWIAGTLTNWQVKTIVHHPHLIDY